MDVALMESGKTTGRTDTTKGSRNKNLLLNILKYELDCGDFQSFIKVDNSAVNPQVLICTTYGLVKGPSYFSMHTQLFLKDDNIEALRGSILFSMLFVLEMVEPALEPRQCSSKPILKYPFLPCISVTWLVTLSAPFVSVC